MFFFRRRILKPAERVLSTQPDDVAALKRWCAAYVGIYALFHSVFMWGLLLRFLRFSLLQVLPFYIAAFLLLLYFAPRRPSNAIG